jgi:hypothetical protein
MNWISLISTVVTFIFVGSVFNRYRFKKGTHLLFWGFGLVWYGLGTLMEVVLSISFSSFALKLWYLCGAMLTAAWLGQGTVYLLVRKRGVARALAIGLVSLSIIAGILVWIAPILPETASAYNPQLPASDQYKEILVRSGLVTFLTIFLNIYGTITLVGGALYSAFLFWRKRVLLHRAIGNVLIAIGALFPAIAGSFVGVGLVDWLYLSELIGVILMYSGFIRAVTPLKAAVENPVPAV